MNEAHIDNYALVQVIQYGLHCAMWQSWYTMIKNIMKLKL